MCVRASVRVCVPSEHTHNIVELIGSLSDIYQHLESQVLSLS